MKAILSIAAALLVGAATGFAQSLPSVKLEQVFPKLSANASLNEKRPVWMSEAPDGSGRMFIVYQPGIILVLKKGSDGSEAKEFFNIEDRHPNMDNEDGLLSMAFHPGFTTNHLFYVYYNQKNPADQNSKPLNFPLRSVISEFKVSDADADKADLASERIVLQVNQPFSNHKGGELVFGPDGYLYLGLGDGGAGGDPFGSGQSTSTLLAKIIRIDVNSRATVGSGKNKHDLQYGFPQDNPFVKEPGNGDSAARKEIFAYGLRNPWRYSFDSKTGALWAGDVGQDLWEEVDLIVKGGNYGWSVREGAHHYKPGPDGAKYIEPVIEYPHRGNMQAQAMYPDHSTGLCVIGGYVYHGKESPALEGVYIYGDYNLGTIWGLRYDYTAQKLTDHGTLLQQPDNINSFAEDNSGEVYTLMQSGKIYKITSK
ncbi:MAG TPA: PQQ-dependent sugar dehydrogenase [Verrucomicrobiae bacterium]|nr:PQQ-dependent sugar dehydrogenase [Verrucomicrobiae bacterium]